MPDAASLDKAIRELVEAQDALHGQLIRLSTLRAVAAVPREITALFRKILVAEQAVLRKLEKLMTVMHRAQVDGFNTGLAAAFMAAGKRDLLARYPEAETQAVILEAQRILSEDPPPAS